MINGNSMKRSIIAVEIARIGRMRIGTTRILSFAASHSLRSFSSVQDENAVPQPSPSILQEEKPKAKSKYIILGSRESRILPRHRPILRKAKLESTDGQSVLDARDPKLQALETQRKQLLEFKKETSLPVVLETIGTMRPKVSVVSSKRYEQLKFDLNRSFLVSQLREYLRSLNQKTSGTKTEVVKRLLESSWGLTVSTEVSEASDVIIERTIDLTAKQLFLIMAVNGNLPRYWTRSGARIAVLSDERKLVIRATKDIYDWISASLHHNLNSIREQRLDLSGLMKSLNLKDMDNMPLTQIQQLSDTYLSYDAKTQTMVASTMKTAKLDLARRLLVQALNHEVGRDESHMTVTPTPPISGISPQYMNSRIIDNEALEWQYRPMEWTRKKLVKSRSQRQTSSNDDSEPGPTISDFLHRMPDPQLTSSITNQLAGLGLTKSSVTYTATLGYVLERPQEPNSSAPTNRSIEKVFLSNVPSVVKRCALLPLYEEEDVTIGKEQDNKSGVTSEDDSTNNLNTEKQDKPVDAWERLLDNDWIRKDDEDDAMTTNHDLPSISPVRVNPINDKNVDAVSSAVASLIQVKLTPSPFAPKDGPDQFRTMPPVELWFELEDGICNRDSVRIIVADKESNLLVSDPTSPCDIKFSATQARFLEPEGQPDSLNQFLQTAHLNVSGERRLYVPPTVKLSIDGKEVEYMYQQLFYRRHADFNYKDKILQLAILEGGGIGGRRIEANLVADFDETNVDDISTRTDELSSFVETAFDLNRSLADPM